MRWLLRDVCIFAVHISAIFFMKIGISGVVIAHNEAQRIADCVGSLQRVCDEVVVVDSFSTDDTVSICESMGCRILQHEFKGHIEQKNWAQHQATYSWILSLDADEVLSDALIAWLLKFREQLSAEDSESSTITENHAMVAWKFPRLNHLSGRAIRGCGWYPDRKVRLWKSGYGAWGGSNPHDRIIVNAEHQDRVGDCGHDILHYTYESYAEVEAQSRKFGTIGAESLRIQGVSKTLLWIKLLSSPWVRWVKNYLINGGICYGKDGWVICYWQWQETFTKYKKALFDTKN